MADYSRLRITLNIAGHSYPMTIEREAEEMYRRAEKEINTLMAKFRGKFVGEEDNYLAMAALQIALTNVEMEMSRSLGEDFDKLIEIDKQLDDYLSSLE